MYREKILLDNNWKFYQGHTPEQDPEFGFRKDGESKGFILPTYDDSTWRSVNLPHDWVVELDFDFDCNEDNGYKAIIGGHNIPNSIGWYRKRVFINNNDYCKKISIEFDGIFRDSIVWVNGHYIDRHLSGYTGFKYDISDYIKFGSENVIVVRVDISQVEGWFYEGGGIYRHVWLSKTNNIHIDEKAIQVISTLNKENVKVKVNCEIINEQKVNCNIDIKYCIKEMGGTVVKVDTLNSKMIINNVTKFTLETNVDNPKLWAIETPNLYEVEISIIQDNEIIDNYSTVFGIREVSFDPDNGFSLNGKQIVLKGVCCHQDFAGVGTALPDSLHYYRIEKLKEMGCNAYRCAHNPPANELLDACDRLGMLVIDERRVMGSGPEGMRQLDELIISHRNHPSIILWAIGNEEHTIQNTEIGLRVANKVIRRIKELDPTRQITYAGNNGNDFSGVNGIVEVRGWNYVRNGNIDKYHNEHPNQPIIGSEEASTLCTRGEYENNVCKGYVSSYDINVPPWGETAEGWIKYYDERKFIGGGFIWTGFDYRGEPTPTHRRNTCSQFGVMDLCGFPKDNFYYYKAWWTEEPVIHIFPHWNFTNKEDFEIDVRVFSNCDEVELFLNEKSYGKKPMKKLSHIKWKLKYIPGVVKAIGYKNNKVIIEKEIKTTGEPYKIELISHKQSLKNNGQDVAVITVKVVDENGDVVPTANNNISFKISGGELIGVGNGDPASTEPDKFYGVTRRTEIEEWQMKIVDNLDEKYVLETINNSEGYKATSVNKFLPINICNVAEDRITDCSEYSDNEAFVGFLEKRHTPREVWVVNKNNRTSKAVAIYRTILTVTEEYIENDMTILKFMGVRYGDARVYINGKEVCIIKAESREFAIDIMENIHIGENIIHVICNHFKGKGGLVEGVYLENNKLKPWSRKVFNGLAMALVQSKENSHEDIVLVANSQGLKSASIIIKQE